jgi:hypothetical protein
MHIGCVRTRLVESDPQPCHLGLNFFYPQEDGLRAYCNAHPKVEWNVVRPAAVIGATTHTSMITFVAFGVYAAVQAQRGEPLRFGGDWMSWQSSMAHTSARLTRYLSE